MNIDVETMELGSSGFLNPGRPLIGFWKWKLLPSPSSTIHVLRERDKAKRRGLYQGFCYWAGPNLFNSHWKRYFFFFNFLKIKEK